MRTAAAVLALLAAVPALAEPDAAAPSAWLETRRDLAAEIQTRVLDPILGPGASRAFVDGALEASEGRRDVTRSGEGSTVRVSTGAAGRQSARQEKRDLDSTTTWRFAVKDLEVRVLHDQAVPAERLDAARKALLAVYAGRLAPERLSFIAAPFAPR